MNITLDNDIIYLLSQIGYNCKINNTDAKAIVNASGTKKGYDDKSVITNIPLARGDYFIYDNLWFLVINEINGKRFNSYYKGTIRRCNYNIKFIFDNELYEFPTIIDGDKFFLSDEGIFTLKADKITCTLPETDKTKLIKVNDQFIKMDSKWVIQGIDRTKDGLITLFCKVDLFNEKLDDRKNEIANRYKEHQDGKVDVLTGEILSSDEEGEPVEPIRPDSPEKPVQNIEYKIEGDYELYQEETNTYIIHKFVDGKEVEGNFTFDLSDINLAEIKETTENLCVVYGKPDQYGEIILTVTDTETNEKIQKRIKVRGIFG